jgi:hypothetical protein
MDNQNNNQEPIKDTLINQSSVNQPPINSETVEVPPQPEMEITSSEPVESTPEPEITPQPELQPQPETPEPSDQYKQILNEYAANTEKKPTIENTIRSTEAQLQDLGISTPPKTGGGFLKTIFVITLIIFIFVFAALVFIYLKNQPNNNSDLSDFDTVEISPTAIPGNCFLNDKTYKVGDSFVAADGCNTCTCESQDIVSCTEKECLSPTSTSAITPVASPSSALDN